MSLPPERISVKRRRQDEPVDILYLGHTEQRDQKRRATDYFFQRVSADATFVAAGTRASAHQTPANTSTSSSTKIRQEQSGIPSVKSTRPGDEVNDFVKYRAARALQQESDSSSATGRAASAGPSINAILGDNGLTPSKTRNLRRFHFTRGQSPSSSPEKPTKVNKTSSHIRPPLPTFVERHVAEFDTHEESKYEKPPVDRIVDPSIEPQAIRSPDARPNQQELEHILAADKIPASTFVKPQAPQSKRGHSIKDHPSTWDHESDQLADELAALAMELDPVAPSHENESMTNDTKMAVDKQSTVAMLQEGDDFVFETYIRVADPSTFADSSEITHRPLNMGVLVIDQEDEELWLGYADSDEESDWDDEDSNAEDNPANDYPEDEVSSDDEYGQGAYRYRRYKSEDEEVYDDDQEQDNDN